MRQIEVNKWKLSFPNRFFIFIPNFSTTAIDWLFNLKIALEIISVLFQRRCSPFIIKYKHAGDTKLPISIDGIYFSYLDNTLALQQLFHIAEEVRSNTNDREWQTSTCKWAAKSSDIHYIYTRNKTKRNEINLRDPRTTRDIGWPEMTL